MITSSAHPIKPELLAPAGDWECARAAVANGANAIYFGLPRFNARLRAENFTAEDLPKLTAFVHEHGVKAYVAMNTLIFTDELRDAERQLILLRASGVDAAIVQDLGLAWLARELVPDFPIHASTQMTITSPEGVAFARRLGVERVVLARETSLREMARFGGPEAVPLEVFVHGALCVAYSGQCLTSEALGQRSANRGECAQACRMPYEMIVDGVKRDLGDRAYLLSPQDLAAVEEIPELIRLGVQSFKIEGRLKSPEYVAAVCQVYRQAIDRAWTDAAQKTAVSPEDRYRLEMVFSRGLYNGWMGGVNHQELVHARFGKKRGPFVGAIKTVGPDFVEVVPEIPLALGDGIVFDTGHDTDREQGGRIYERRGDRLYFQHGKIDFSKLRSGHRIWKTDDPQLTRELRKTFAEEPSAPKQPLDLHVEGAAGGPLKISASRQGETFTVESSMPLQPAQKRPLTAASLRDQLGRLGESPFSLGELTADLRGDVILPVSELNRLRRQLVEHFLSAPAPPPVVPKPPVPIVEEMLSRIRSAEPSTHTDASPNLAILCRNLEQIEALLEEGVAALYADFEDIRRYKDAVSLVRRHPGARLFLATPRIQKAGEEGFFKLIENAAPDGVLIRNLGALDYFRNSPLARIGDFSLNVANPLTASLLKKESLDRLTISYDLNAEQVLDLVRAAPASWFEMTLHQHIPMFHMEHCVFAAFLSTGTDHTNCGRPCDRHQLELRDRVGMKHPVKADVGCRNTVFQGRSQSGAAFFDAFIQAGLRFFRLELLLESPEETRDVVRAYQDLLAGKIDGHDLLLQLKTENRLGVTSGPLAVV